MSRVDKFLKIVYGFCMSGKFVISSFLLQYFTGVFRVHYDTGACGFYNCNYFFFTKNSDILFYLLFFFVVLPKLLHDPICLYHFAYSVIHGLDYNHKVESLDGIVILLGH